MATGRAFCALSFICLALKASAADFLTARVQVAREDVRQLLLSELSGHVNAPRLASIEKGLRQMFVSLPKNEVGRLEPSVVRYALHRYFVQKHG